VRGRGHEKEKPQKGGRTVNVNAPHWGNLPKGTGSGRVSFGGFG